MEEGDSFNFQEYLKLFRRMSKFLHLFPLLSMSSSRNLLISPLIYQYNHIHKLKLYQCLHFIF